MRLSNPAGSAARRPRLVGSTVKGMETWDAIRARRNVRSFDLRPIPSGDLERILEAAWRSPSASNRQKWDFILVVDRAQLEELATVWVGAKHLAGSAAAVVMVLPEPESDRYLTIDQYDLGQATMAMTLAAADLGVGSGHSAVGDQEACRRILGVPPTGTVPTCLPWVIRRTNPWRRSSAPIADPSMRSSTGATGSGEAASRSRSSMSASGTHPGPHVVGPPGRPAGPVALAAPARSHVRDDPGESAHAVTPQQRPVSDFPGD
jgi:Nitroreductase family